MRGFRILKFKCNNAKHGFIGPLFNWDVAKVFFCDVIEWLCLAPPFAKSFGNLAATKRRYAVIYVLGVFFLIPTLLIIISKLL